MTAKSGRDISAVADGKDSRSGIACGYDRHSLSARQEDAGAQ